MQILGELAMVLACEMCNSTTKKDDEYFRLIIAGAANDSSAAGAVLRDKILPGAEVRPGLLKKITATIGFMRIRATTISTLLILFKTVFLLMK